MTLVRGDDAELAQELLAHLGRRDHLVFAESALHRYDSATGVWCALDEAYLSRVVQGFAGTLVVGPKPYAQRISAGAVRGAIKLACDQVADPKFFARATPGLAFANGFLQVTPENLRLDAHAPEHRARFAYAFPYEPTEEPTRLLKFFASVFEGDPEADLKVGCIRQFGGLALCGRATRMQRALVLVGSGADAKSTAATIIEAIMPPGSRCSVPPQRWRNELHAAHLVGKLLNVVLELPEQALADTDAVKLVIAGDPVGAREIKRNAFTFRPIAGHIFAANVLPRVKDGSRGFWRRWIVLRFPRAFGAGEQNPDLAQEIVSAELPAIVSWFIDGARAVLAQRRYTIPASSHAELGAWKGKSLPVEAFVESCTAPAEQTERTPAGQLYQAYRSFAEQHDLPVVTENMFGRTLTRLGHSSVSDGKCWSYALRLGRLN